MEPGSQTFEWRGHTVSRTGFALSHARVLTSTACQGNTFRFGVVADAGRRDGGAYPTPEDDFWLHLYVMLSRATSAEDILVARPPPSSFLGRGPPVDLAEALRSFAARTQACRKQAEALAKEFGLQVPDP